MEKILMHPIISQAMAAMTRTSDQEKEREMAGVLHLINTRKHIADAHQAARNAADELECGLAGNYDAGDIVEVPKIRQGWIQKRVREAIDLGLPDELRKACEAYLDRTGGPSRLLQPKGRE